MVLLSGKKGRGGLTKQKKRPLLTPKKLIHKIAIQLVLSLGQASIGAGTASS